MIVGVSSWTLSRDCGPTVTPSNIREYGGFEMKERIIVRLSPELAAKLCGISVAPGLRHLSLYPGQAVPQRPQVERATVDPVSAVFDRQHVLKGAT